MNNQGGNYPTYNNDNIQSSMSLNKKVKNRNLQQSTPQIGGIPRIETEKKMSKLLNQQFMKKASTKKNLGKLYIGANFDKNTLNAFDKAKMMDTLVFIVNNGRLTQRMEHKGYWLRKGKSKS